jgi:hypothetical protein
MARLSAVAVLIALAACGSGRAQVTGPTAVERASAQALTVEITAETVRIRVGDELMVRRPSADRRWEMTGNDVLELLASPDDTRDVWRFRARRSGRDELTFTGHSRDACPTPADCPPQPAPPRLLLRVEVQD